MQGIYHGYHVDIVYEEGWMRNNDVYEYEKSHFHAVASGIGDECSFWRPNHPDPEPKTC